MNRLVWQIFWFVCLCFSLIPVIVYADTIFIDGMDRKNTLWNGFGRKDSYLINSDLANEIDGVKKNIPWSGDLKSDIPETVDKLKQEIVQLARDNKPINIVAHSYGTVIAYIALLELQRAEETKDIRVNSLITLGSPLGENVDKFGSIKNLTMEVVKELVEIKGAINLIERLPAQIVPLENVYDWTNVHSAQDFVSGEINVLDVKNIQIERKVESAHPHEEYYKAGAVFQENGQPVLLSETLQAIIYPANLQYADISPLWGDNTYYDDNTYYPGGGAGGGAGGGGGGGWGDDPGQQQATPYIPPNLPPTTITPPINTGDNSGTNGPIGGNPPGNNSTENNPSTASFKFASNVDAPGYSVQTAGSLTAGTAVGTGAWPSSVAVDPTGRFAYVTNQTANTISVYTINQSTGALTAGTEIAAGVGPYFVAVDPTGRFAYVANMNSGWVYFYTINQTTGALTYAEQVGGTSEGTMSVVVDPTGRFAYVASGFRVVRPYTINQTTGALTAGTEVAAGTGPYFVAIDPTGRFAYVTNADSDNVSVFTINQTTGALTVGANVATGDRPRGIAVDPTGRFAYVANFWSNTVSVYSINQATGALTPVTTVAAEVGPEYVAVDPTGRFVYVANYYSNTVSVFTINQTTGALTVTGAAVAAGTHPLSIAVDPTGRFVYVANWNSSCILSVYTMDPSVQMINNTLTGSISGTSSTGGAAAVTMTGSYDPASPSSFVWGQTVNSYNSSTGQNTTYDTPANAYAGYLTGYKADDNTMKAKWASIYVKDNGSAGIHLGALTGTAASPNYTMSGTINAPVEMVSGAIGFTPANLYPAHVTTTSLVNGTPVLAGGNFSGGGAISPSYHKWEGLGITGQGWGVWNSVSGGTYTGPISSGWSLSEDYNYAAAKTITGGEVKGTSWTGNKLEGTKAGYGADVNTGKTWVSIGDVIGTYDPVAFSYQAVASGSWIETDRFLWMTANEPSKLQSLNIPCVQVGNVNLTGSNDYGTGTMNVTMNNMKFFANTAGGPAKIWAVGQSQMGSWTGAAPPAGTAASISGGGLSATFTVKTFDTATTNKFNAAITNGTGGFNGSTTFRGAAAGTINTGSKTFSGTAAGVAK